MKQFLLSNVTWLYRYFDKNKGLLEIFSFLMVAQSFMYSSDLRDINVQSVSAFKIVLWILIFLVIILLQISTSVELWSEGEKTFNSVLSGANFMKTLMRLLTLVLLVASVPIFIEQIQISLHNSLFSVFYGSLAIVILLELLAFGITLIAPNNRHRSGAHTE